MKQSVKLPSIILRFHLTEGIAGALFCMYVLFRLMSYPGAFYIFLAILGLWSILTVLSPFYAKAAYPDDRSHIWAWATLWSLAVAYLGLFFQLMSWPYADILTITATLPVLVCGVYFGLEYQKYSARSMEGWLARRMIFRLALPAFRSLTGIAGFVAFVIKQF